MAKVGICKKCGIVRSELWSRLEICPSCGGLMEHEEEDLGLKETVPRLLNIAGAIVLIVLIVSLVMTGRGIGLIEILGLVFGPLLILLSLSMQISLSRQLIESKKKQMASVRSDSTGITRSKTRYGRGGQSESEPVQGESLPVKYPRGYRDKKESKGDSHPGRKILIK